MSDRWLYDFDHFPMKIDDNPEASHAQVIPHILGKPGVTQLLKLIQGVLKLLPDHGNRENIILTKYFRGLFTQKFFITADSCGYRIPDLSVDLFSGDMAQKTAVVQHITWVTSYPSHSQGLIRCIKNQAFK